MLKVLIEISKEIAKKGGQIFLVGGCVRDRILGKENKDIDVEVFGITPNVLKEILSKFGVVDEIGTSFGILKIHGIDIDFAMPRKERKIGQGHKGFDVSVDPFMSLKEASKRRDFTINAIMQNIITGEIIDMWGGQEDLKNGIIRHIDDRTFVEDPLRVLRACQFASRFNFTIAEETKKLCKTIDLSTLPKERIFEEIKKGLLKAKNPSIMFKNMLELGVVDKLFPELKTLVGCMQNPEHHPEGDVWTHTMMVLDGAVNFREEIQDEKEKLIFMFGALCHDLGKPITTQYIDGKITSYKHDIEGEKPTKSFLHRITEKKDIMNNVVDLVVNHMRVFSLNSDKSIRRFLVDCKNPELVLKLSIADHRGRKGHENDDMSHVFELMEKIKEMQKTVEPVVKGRDLINLGFKPGKEIGVLLRKAFEIQIQEGITDKEELIKRVVSII